MIKKHKWKLLAASVVTLLSGLFAFFTPADQPGGQSIRWILLGMPLLLLGLMWLCIWLTTKDPKGNEQNRKVMTLVIWLIPALSLLVGGEFLALSMGNTSIVRYALPVFIGVTFMLIGNYMPKCKQSFTMGIKIRWTLANEENWFATHRFAGKLWMVGGLLILPLAFLPMMTMLYVMLGIVVLMVVPPMIYSWLYYKKQVEEGKAEPNPKLFQNKKEKRMGVGSMIAVGIVLIGVFVLVFTASFEIAYGETSFTVSASTFGEVTVEYADIESVEYWEAGTDSHRVMGFGDYPLQMGIFRNDTLGQHDRYTHSSCKAVVVIRYEGNYLVLNGKTPEATQEIYQTLLAK